MVHRYSHDALPLERRSTPFRPPESLGRRQRLLLVSFGVFLLAMLVLAAVLRPDPAGLGTHEQLGLPQCSLRLLYGTRCPACGMTTSWAHYVRGHWIQACQANVGGFVLAMLATVIAPWAIMSGGRGRWFWTRLNDCQIFTIALITITVIILDWIVRIRNG